MRVGVVVEVQAGAPAIARALAEVKAGASAGGRIQSLGLDQNLGPIPLGVLYPKVPAEVGGVISCNGGACVDLCSWV